jgi:hypothetical protein
MLLDMDVWQALLLFVAAYVAVNSLVKLMRAQRDTLKNEFRQQAAEERAKRQRDEAEKKRRGGQAA